MGDTGASQDSREEAYSDISTVRIRDGQHQITLYHVGVFSALIWTFEIQLPQPSHQVCPRDR